MLIIFKSICSTSNKYYNFGGVKYYEKIKTISTLVAGLGIAFLGHTTHADAAENNNQQQSTYNYSTTDVSFSKSGNLYTSGQCTWYVYDKTGGKIGSTWGMQIAGHLQLKQQDSL